MNLKSRTKRLPFCRTLIGLSIAVAGSAIGETPSLRSERVPLVDLKNEPYRFNGMLRSGQQQGSGFCAWNRQSYFSAANQVFGADGWADPPIWRPSAGAAGGDGIKSVRTRGYYRWRGYSELLSLGKANAAFGKDVILGFALEPLIGGRPAVLNLNGTRDLGRSFTTMITGFPERNPVNGRPLRGFPLHRTPPTVTTFENLSGDAWITDSISTDPGMIGGPVWMRGSSKRWAAAGLLVGETPSETTVCAFSTSIRSFLRAAGPVVAPRPRTSIGVRNVGASSMFFPYNRRHVIPDGIQRWSSFRLGVRAFDRFAKVGTVKLSVNIRTSHRGDLRVILSGPGGYQAVIHDGQGGKARDLIIRNRDVSAEFQEIRPNGTWFLRVQDRTKGDTAVLESFQLEIAEAQDRVFN